MGWGSRLPQVNKALLEPLPHEIQTQDKNWAGGGGEKSTLAKEDHQFIFQSFPELKGVRQKRVVINAVTPHRRGGENNGTAK